MVGIYGINKSPQHITIINTFWLKLPLKVKCTQKAIRLSIYYSNPTPFNMGIKYKRFRTVVINDKELDKEIDWLCEKQDRSFSNLARRLLKDEINKEKEKG